MEKHLRLNITRKCDLRCEYCVSHKNEEKGQSESYLEEVGPLIYLTQISSLLRNINTDDLVIDLKGEGDVLASPYLLDVVSWCFENEFNIEFQTNLMNFSDLEGLIQDYYDVLLYENVVTKITFNISFHAGVLYSRKIKYDRFWINLDELVTLQRKYPKFISLGKVDIPLSPSVFESHPFHLDDDLIRLRGPGFTLNPAILVGTYRGKEYPQDYTDQEKLLVSSTIKYFKPLLKNYHWTAEQIQYVKHRLELKGNLCDIRMKRVDIMADGRIRYCQSIPPWFSEHNLRDLRLNKKYHEVKLFETEMVPCPADQCGCMSLGIEHCLIPNFRTIYDYFKDFYEKTSKEISNLFNI